MNVRKQFKYCTIFILLICTLVVLGGLTRTVVAYASDTVKEANASDSTDSELGKDVRVIGNENIKSHELLVEGDYCIKGFLDGVIHAMITVLIGGFATKITYSILVNKNENADKKKKVHVYYDK